MQRLTGIFSYFKARPLKYTKISQIVSRMDHSSTPLKSMKAIVQTEMGGPDTFKVGDVPFPEPKEGETIVKILYTGVNRADTLQRKGAYPPPPGASNIIGLEFLGFECNEAGVPLDENKPVMGILAGGGYAQYARVPKSHLIRVPAGLDLDVAAAIPEVWLTSFQLINLVGGGIGKGEYALVHAAASGVGTSILQLMKTYEAKAIAVASKEEKLETCKALGAIGGINYKENPEFGDQVMSLTDGHGADLILDCVGASHWEQNEKSLARDGTWVIYGLMGGSAPSSHLGRLLGKRATVTFTTLRTRSNEYKAKLAERFEKEAVPLFEKGVLKPVVNCVMPLSDIKAAHELMETNTTVGKIVLKNDL